MKQNLTVRLSSVKATEVHQQLAAVHRAVAAAHETVAEFYQTIGKPGLMDREFNSIFHTIDMSVYVIRQRLNCELRD